ncbi:MAG: hypothetical protein AAF636_13180 [Pseudomonadota bacterium]
MSGKNYLIMLGAPKCGTTSLSAWIGEQPYAVLAKQKETLYFTDFSDRAWSGPRAEFVKRQPLSIEAFHAEFDDAPDAELRVEASTDNLSCLNAVENIARFVERDDVGKFWLVAILRDPVDRIVSEYEHTLRLGWQTGSLLKSLQLEKERAEKGYHPLFWHTDRSRYFKQIERYREMFGDHLMILDFAKIRDAQERDKLLNWMGYSDEAQNALQHSNKRSVTARPATASALKNKRLRKLGRTFVPKNIRSNVRNLITGGEMERYKIRDSEIEFIRNVLDDDIQACIESYHIPTENWTLSLSR